jgi:hypothetical protein
LDHSGEMHEMFHSPPQTSRNQYSYV